MTEVFDTKDLVSELVPHKGKMLLLDRVRDYDLKENSITTEIDIARGSKCFCVVWNLWPCQRRKTKDRFYHEREWLQGRRPCF